MSPPAILLAALVLAAAAVPSCARKFPGPKGGPFPELVVFGDSTADPGNLFAQTVALGTTGVPNGTYYYQGRFTNGPNFVDWTQSETEIRTLNYAIGGATFCGFNPPLTLLGPIKAGLDDQISAYLADVEANRTAAVNAAPRRVAFIGLGSNDWLVSLFADATATLTNPAPVLSSVSACLAAGLQRLAATRTFGRIYVATPAPLEILPGILASLPAPARAGLKAILDAHKAMLVATTQAALGSSPTAPAWTVLDFAAALRTAVAAAPAGVTVTAPCMLISNTLIPDPIVYSLCPEPKNYYFYDHLHPTTLIYKRVLAPVLINQLKADKLVKCDD